MKTLTLLKRGTVLLYFTLCLASPLQLPFQRPLETGPTSNLDHAFRTQPKQSNLTPYSMAWVNELQAIYNTFGGIKNDTSCPTELQDWSCQPYPLSAKDLVPPKDVWHLRPHDIKAVISVGDSISAGFAMTSSRPPFATVLEFRGKVFSDGGDDGEYTLANFLKTYTKNIYGSPSGFTPPLAHGKDLNTAVSGAIAQTLSSQIERLRWQFGLGGRYRRYKNEWKLATVFIGANNLCAACGPGAMISEIADPEEYGRALKSALQGLRDSVGPTFVNLVGIFDVTLVYDLSRGYPYCEMLFDQVPIPICGCASGNEADRQRAGDLARKYNEIMERIAKEINEESKGQGTFGVAFQPGLTGFKDGSSAYGQGYLSGLDCFHPNKCANQVMAISLWNNMFARPEDKNRPMKPDNLEIYCPGPSDYLQ